MIKRFWSKVARGSIEECWPWLAGKSLSGYGTFSIKYQGLRANRVAYELAIGPIPERLVVRHKCDNPICCNPCHLEIGTNRDNTHDAMRRGRWSPPPLQTKGGEDAPRAKFTNEQVVEIRELYNSRQMNQTDLARLHGVATTAIWAIVHMKTYKNIGAGKASNLAGAVL